MSKSSLLLGVLLVAVLVAPVVLGGCGGGTSTILFFNVIERPSWSVGDRLAFASYGGDGLAYVWSVDSSGGGAVSLTPTTGDDGWHPAYSPDGSDIAFVSGRGLSPALYIMDAANGDREGADEVTDDDDTGGDMQPSWKPDESGLIYTSTRRNNNHDIRTIDADGTNLDDHFLDSDDDEQWASYNPTDDDEIALQSDRDKDNDEDNDIFTYEISTTTFTKVADSSYSDGAPAWNPAGDKIAFHSDRRGNFDIWVCDLADPGNPSAVTSGSYEDGYPVWNSDGSRIAFWRDGQLYSVAADGTDEQRITRRY